VGIPDDIPDNVFVERKTMKIYTGNDRAKEVEMQDRLGKVTFQTYRELQAYLMRLNFGIELPTEYTDERPVEMRIDHSRMIAVCECGGASYVQPEDNYFFCNVCHNEAVDGKLRRVIFPKNLGAICDELLKREVQTVKSLPPTQAAAVARGLPQSWNPGETIKMLEKQRLEA
jgi:hypothetical protein